MKFIIIISREDYRKTKNYLTIYTRLYSTRKIFVVSIIFLPIFQPIFACFVKTAKNLDNIRTAVYVDQ